jgi:hypothetical protein
MNKIMEYKYHKINSKVNLVRTQNCNKMTVRLVSTEIHTITENSASIGTV